MKRPILLTFALCLLSCFAVLAQQATDHIYVVVINGGMNKLMNHERYWNDCAFLYRTLRHDYHIPKRNFSLLLSDGGDPGPDMLREGGRGFASSPDDLDGDGECDVWLSATYANVSATLTSLAGSMTSSDHLFLFFMDHGGSDDGAWSSYLWLWGGEKLYDTALASLLDLFQIGSMNILMGQCNSGGFIDNLQRSDCVIATACRGDELSWMCPDKPYDEFVYHWICAVAGHDETGQRVNADVDHDGRVSMDEAFDYARRNDQSNETPQYSSLPANIGRRWAFGGVLTEDELVVDAPLADGTVVATPYDLRGIRSASCQPLGIGKRRKIIKKR